jgi:hypothetical protein
LTSGREPRGNAPGHADPLTGEDAALQRPPDVADALRDGVLQRKSEREICRYGGRQRASGAVRRRSRYAAPFDDEEPLPVPEEVSNPIARPVTTFHEDRSDAELGDSPRRRFLIGGRSDLHAGKGRCFVEVRRNEVAERQELADDRTKTGR